ncbi:MAG: MATE family efflux transporter [Bacteroidia bacterium]|nr:MATE family efflux transporter [Bacteroidia bacterium]MDW8014440.1 MATE family efflux transporter [Bacteroidia bacterium]
MQSSYKQILRLALPIMGASLAQNLVSLIDTAFLGLLGQTELAAGGIGVLFFLTIGFVGLGLGTGVQVLSAQLLGADRAKELSALLRQSLWIGGAVGLLLTMGVIASVPSLLPLLLHDIETIHTTTVFLQGRSLELPALILFGILRGYYSGTAQTSFILQANLLLASINLLLNALFVIGLEWGLKGVIAGSVLSQYLATAYLFWALTRQAYRLEGGASAGLWIKPLFRYAGPAVLQHLIGMAGWVFFFLLIERRGQFALAAANIVRSLYSFCMLPTWAFSTAVGTLTGFFWGAKDRPNLVAALRRALVLSQGLNILICIGLIGCAPLIVQIFTKDIALQVQVRQDLWIIGISLILMPPSALLLSAVVGVGRVVQAFLVEVGIILLYVGYASSMDQMSVSLTWMWSAEWVYWIPSAGVLYFLWRRQIERLSRVSLVLS